ncbi:hypothetical protein TNCT_260091 [Trichonephila clavata]|uniref:Uncharacterized protein n=1 Tax=Trichonephila clavata TaxID=2740835 RepID=A0A8X6FB62_TRICU|nr:hypothetical protein TNCT_260091 [Trichonephila clavata]
MYGELTCSDLSIKEGDINPTHTVSIRVTYSVNFVSGAEPKPNDSESDVTERQWQISSFRIRISLKSLSVKKKVSFSEKKILVQYIIYAFC